MNKFLHKIPSLFYAIIVIALSIFLTHYLEIYLISINWVTQTEGEARVALYSSVLTVIAIFYAVLQLQSQRNESLFANEYINQPEFEFYRFGDDENLLKKESSPGCCCIAGQVCTNNCNDEHWFNLKQIGNLPATDIKISMFHNKESNNICCKTRIMKIETLNKNGVFQYKLPPYTYSEQFFDQTKNDSFFVLLSYKSLYSNLHYKRIYELEYIPKSNAILTNGIWADNIKFYAVELKNITDYNSISLKDLIIGSLAHFLVKIKLKNSYSKENWILKY
ncbi:hypothetical protein SAMN04488062_10456 [Flavobacterium omnivorum]|uniref:Uncharacterized protein n=1 Tax=Flavobacterium omnivorum TaxID=178355 RepID=A0A1G7ZI82_9FLAO|nr:hypothetical protein [Flavobacterium omnivorum]SDH07790.1 hypothetical protein SAMN04488062_10456 [Flavobacterium omnivorum]